MPGNAVKTNRIVSLLYPIDKQEIRQMYGRLTMICNAIAIGAVCAMLAPGIAGAQEQSLASTLEVYVFPAKGQGSSQQSEDEAECYQWAVSNTGTDPFELSKQEAAGQQQAQADAQAAQQAGKGSGAGGAVAGAAAGALIGEIAHDDASEGAAWGAAVGAIAGRRRGKAAQQQTAAQAEQQAAAQQQAIAEQTSNFKKAFSVCLEGKNYLVKY
jgi:hypothetical protein